MPIVCQAPFQLLEVEQQVKNSCISGAFVSEGHRGISFRISLIIELFPQLGQILVMSRLSRCLVQSLTLTNAKLHSHQQQAPKWDLSPDPGAPFLGVKALAVSAETEWGAAAAASHLTTHTKSWLHISSSFQKEIHHGSFSIQGGEGGWEVHYAVSGIRYRKINITGTRKRSKPLIKDVDPTSTTPETQYQPPGRSYRVGRRFPRHRPAGKRVINMHKFAKTCVGSKRLGT